MEVEIAVQLHPCEDAIFNPATRAKLAPELLPPQLVLPPDSPADFR